MVACRLNRTMNKAPVGLLVAWLRAGVQCADRTEHFARRRTLTRAEREDARAWVAAQPELQPLLAAEADALGRPAGTVCEPEDAR